jgi:aspartyl-tRNA synthetase
MYGQGGSTALGRFRLRLSELAQSFGRHVLSCRAPLSLSTSQGDLQLPKTPHFLWITEFPLFTRADKDKEFLAQGRWSSSHHPFTAPMWQDIPAMYEGHIQSVRSFPYESLTPRVTSFTSDLRFAVNTTISS